MLLGDLGADVIKVERPGTGDESRTWGPPFDGEGRSAYYLSINRNKLGLLADLSDESGRRDVERLLADADVVVDNFLPGVLDRQGLARPTGARGGRSSFGAPSPGSARTAIVQATTSSPRPRAGGWPSPAIRKATR